MSVGDSEADFNRAVKQARGRRVSNEDMFFTPWAIRVAMTVIALLLIAFIGVGLAYWKLNDAVHENRSAIRDNNELTTQLADAAFKNRAVNCEIVFLQKAPLPPSCLQPEVVRNLPAELQRTEPFVSQGN